MQWLTDFLWRWSAKFLPFAVVDINGNGHFWTVDDAIDSGKRLIFIKDGTYPGFTMDVTGLVIVGQSPSVIIDGGTTSHAVTLSANKCVLANLTVQSTGGEGNAYDGAAISGHNNLLANVWIADADRWGFYITGQENLVIACTCSTADSGFLGVEAARNRMIGNYTAATSGNSVEVSANGDNFMLVGNHSEGSIVINANGDNGLCVANMADVAVTDNGTGNTTASNEVY